MDDIFDKHKTVDFDGFDLDDGFNYDRAKELCYILMSYQNVDELTFFEQINEGKYPTSIGTGGTGMIYKVQTEAQQRSLLASHFASYASREYTSCFLSVAEYECLQNLLVYLQEDILSAHREQIVAGQIDLLIKTCSEFEKLYVKKDPNFLFTMLKK